MRMNKINIYYFKRLSTNVKSMVWNKLCNKKQTEYGYLRWIEYIMEKLTVRVMI